MMRWLLLITSAAAVIVATDTDGPCQHGSVFVHVGPQSYCLCLGAYHGDRCELPTKDFCASATCPVGHWCFNELTTHTCQCSQLVDTDVCRRLPTTDDEALVRLKREVAELTDHDITRTRAQWGPMGYRHEAATHDKWIQRNLDIMMTWYRVALRPIWADLWVAFVEFDKRYAAHVTSRLVDVCRILDATICLNGGYGNNTALVSLCQGLTDEVCGNQTALQLYVDAIVFTISSSREWSAKSEEVERMVMTYIGVGGCIVAVSVIGWMYHH